MARTLYKPRVLTIGDSQTNGSMAQPAAGWRSAFDLALKVAGASVWLVGRPDLANGGNGTAGNPAGVLAIDPFTDGAPGSFLLANINDASSSFAPDITTLQGGTNNISIGQDAATILGLWTQELKAVGAFMQASWKQIVVFQMFKRLDAGDAVCQAINAGLPAVIASLPFADRVTLFPCYNLVPNADYVDAIHFNATGADIVGNALAPIVAPLVRKVQASTAIG